MPVLIAFALMFLRLTGYFIEPRLSDHEIHAIAGEPSRVTPAPAAGRPLTVVTWNIERGEQFDRIADMLTTLDADVILLQEADRFCSRSGHRDIPRELAVRLQMNFVTGGEFQEIGEGRRGQPCVTGQAILSRTPIDETSTLRFAEQAAWKWRLNPAQPRRGGRVALRARTSGAVFYSVHLESGNDEQRRANQLRDIVQDSASRGEPVIIGGDFNNLGDATSSMFAALGASGFANAMSNEREYREVARRPIDWIFTRHASASARVVRAIGASDHDPVVADTSVQRRF